MGSPVAALKPAGAEPRLHEPFWLQHQAAARDLAAAVSHCSSARHGPFGFGSSGPGGGNPRGCRQDEVPVIPNGGIEGQSLASQKLQVWRKRPAITPWLGIGVGCR